MFPLRIPYPFAPEASAAPSGFRAAWAARQQNRLIGARMYPRNAASPGRLYLGPVVQISDGAVQTSGVAVTVTPFGGSETSGAGTIAYSTKGGVWYTPTQAETDYTSFVIEASKTGCIPAGVVVVTTASSTSGTVLLAPVTHTSAVVPTVSAVTGLTAADVGAIKTKTDQLTFSGSMVEANMKKINGTTLVGNGASPKFGV